MRLNIILDCVMDGQMKIKMKMSLHRFNPHWNVAKDELDLQHQLHLLLILPPSMMLYFSG